MAGGSHVIRGDSAVVLGHFEDCSIDAVVTDPPHGLGGEHLKCELSEDAEGNPQIAITFTEAANGFMGASWDKGIGAFGVWREVYRVLKPGGHCFVMSSERAGGVAGFYLLLKAAGFIIDETQLLSWIALTGMPKSSDTGKVADKQAFRDWLDHVGADLTNAERRKAASAAVNGCHSSAMTRDTGTYYWEAQGQQRDWYTEQRSGKLSGEDLLSRLLATHWPDSPSERREHWEAVVREVPEDWDCSRPPGVRVKVGDNPNHRKPQADDRVFKDAQPHTADGTITRPSTPDAVALEGRRASVAPLKPFAYPIIHAQKPCEGSYLANWRKWGTGPMGVGDARIPFESGARLRHNEPSAANEYERSEVHNWGGTIKGDDAGRTPSNLLSYGDLLGDLQRYCDLDAWCEALGLPESAAALLEAGLVYAPKSSRAEKNRGLPDDYAAKRNPCAKPVALCAYLTVLATVEGQTVLDPFCGEGPVGVAAALMKRRFVGVELEEDFCKTARLRIAEARTLAATDDTRAEVSAQPALMEVAAK